MCTDTKGTSLSMNFRLLSSRFFEKKPRRSPDFERLPTEELVSEHL